MSAPAAPSGITLINSWVVRQPTSSTHICYRPFLTFSFTAPTGAYVVLKINGEETQILGPTERTFTVLANALPTTTEISLRSENANGFSSWTTYTYQAQTFTPATSPVVTHSTEDDVDKFTWTSPNPYVYKYVLEVRRLDSVVWDRLNYQDYYPQNGNVAYANLLLPAKLYKFRARAVSVYPDARSYYVTGYGDQSGYEYSDNSAEQIFTTVGSVVKIVGTLSGDGGTTIGFDTESKKSTITLPYKSYCKIQFSTPTLEEATWSATGLPTGLSINSTTGVISGTATQYGTYNFSVSVTDGIQTFSGNFIAYPGVLKITSPSSLQLNNKVQSSFGVQTNAPAGTVTFSASNLPSYLYIDSSTGVVSGATTSAGTFTADITATSGSDTATQSLQITVIPLQISSTLSQSANELSSYSYQIRTNFGNGTYFTATNLPAGLSINQQTGAITGSPTETGTFVVPIAAQTSNDTATAALTLVVNPYSISITSAGSAYFDKKIASSFQVTTNAPSSIADQVLYSASGLPDGMAISPTTGLVFGTPTTSGIVTTTVTATRLGVVATKQIAFTVRSMQISSSLSVSGIDGVAFSYQIRTNFGAPESYSATGLPSGLVIDEETGIISGTPTQAGVYSASISATLDGETATATLQITVAGLSITSPSSVTIQGHQLLVYKITSNVPTATFTAVVPSWAAFSGNTITGRTVRAGTYQLVITATNGEDTATKTVNVIVQALAKPVIDTTLTQGKVITSTTSAKFVFQPVATNWPDEWTSTLLPGRLSLNQSTGSISGFFKSPGLYSVEMRASNGLESDPVVFNFLAEGAEGGGAGIDVIIEMSDGSVTFSPTTDEGGAISPAAGSTTAASTAPQKTALKSMFVKRGDTPSVNITFVKFGKPTTPDFDSLKFAAKSGAFSSYLLMCTEYEPIAAGVFRMYPDFGSSAITSALEETDSCGEKELVLRCEVQWSSSETGMRGSSRTFECYVARDLIYPD